MRRTQKLTMALGIALALHAVVLLYVFAPQLDGLTAVPGETSLYAVPTPDTAGDIAVDIPNASKALEADAALDIDWPVPEEKAVIEEPPATIDKPKPRPVPAKSEPEPRPAAKLPETKPQARSVEAGRNDSAPIISADASYANRVRQHLARYAGALPPGASGEARVQFVVQPDGRVSNVLLVMRSGNAGLDSVALSLPTLAQPLPLPGPLPQRLEVPVQAIAATP